MKIEFEKYFDEISLRVKRIPKSNSLFWGNWFCNHIFYKYQNEFNNFLTKKEIKLLEDLIIYLWNLVDNNLEINFEEIKKKIKFLQEIDETNLETTGETECALYELIISLDAIFNDIESNSWTYNLSQTTINIIDTILDEQNINTLSSEGFSSDIFQKEVLSQYKLINYLETNLLIKSTSKNIFR